MFRELRRSAQQLPHDVCIDILNRGSYGVLSVLGDGNYPYPVPVNYVYVDGTIYIHCAVDGHKTDAVRGHDRAGFCVVDAHDVIPSSLSTDYRSVIVFGRARLVVDEGEKDMALRTLCAKYAPEEKALMEKEMAELGPRTAVIALDVEHVDGKESRKLAKERREKALS